MKNVWYYEDRKLPSNEQKQAMTETKAALENSTLMTRLLKGIIEKEIESTYVNEEDYSWQTQGSQKHTKDITIEVDHDRRCIRPDRRADRREST
jgi:hypothetical protein